MKRRKFMLSLVGSAAVAGWAGLTLTNDRLKTGLPDHLAKVKRSGWALGTQVTLTLFHENPQEAERAIEAAFRELDSIEAILSLYRPDSQICRLNESGHLDAAHPYLIKVLEKSREMSAVSDGAFDITIQPLYALHAQQTNGESPPEKSLAEALNRVGWQQVRITGNDILLGKPGAAITLNGIAQGFASDRVKTVLCEHGIRHALVDTGEIGALGEPAGRAAWSIGVKHPRNPGAYVCVADLNGKALATSGDYETCFDETYTRHHLLDPKTGRSPQELSSVTVAAGTGMEADALSTTLFLLGLEKGRALLRKMPGTDALFITKSGELHPVGSFPMRS